MISQSLGFFGCAPGTPVESIDFCTNRCERVIDRKKVIKTRFFKLSLANDTASVALIDRVRRPWKKAFDQCLVVRMPIRFKMHICW